MSKFLRYLGIAALGFLAVAAIGVTLGASAMLACYLTTCGICRVQRAAIQEVREIDEETERVRAQSPNENELDPLLRTVPERVPERVQEPEQTRERPEDRRTWARSETPIPNEQLDSFLDRPEPVIPY